MSDNSSVPQTTHTSQTHSIDILDHVLKTAMENAPGALAGMILMFVALLVILQKLKVFEYINSLHEKIDEMKEKLENIERDVKGIKEEQKDLNEKIWDTMARKNRIF